MAKSHTVRTAEGGTKAFDNFTRGFAIKAMCSECCGWESSPMDCTAILCALYPFRGKTLLTREGEGSELDPEGEKADLKSLAVASERDDSGAAANDREGGK